MGLDASIGNRAKDNYNLAVDYSTIYKTNDDTEIRKLLSLEYFILDWFNSQGANEKKNIIKKIAQLSELTDRELAEKRNSKSEVLKNMFKPAFEVLSYTTADDNSVAMLLLNNQTKKTLHLLIKLNGDLTSHVENLDNTLIELQNSDSSKKNQILIAKIKKELEILTQIKEREGLRNKA